MEKKYFRVKSTDENFIDEESDIKNNTVRFTDDWDKKRWGVWNNATHIKVINRVTKRFFVRKIRHKCLYLNVTVTTWQPKQS